MKKQKVDNSGVEEAQRAIARANEAARNLEQNYRQDLSTANVAQVTAGGTADVVDAAMGSQPKRRRQGTGLSSQLGLNV